MNTKLRLDGLQPNKIRWIGIGDFENLCFWLAKEHMSFKQPIPEFITRQIGILESCLETPHQTFEGFEPYPKFVDKLSLLFYLLIKNHPFQNGNKRIGVATLFVVLFLNGFWIKAGKLTPYNLAKRVAKSKTIDKAKTVKSISRFIYKYIVEVKN